MALRFRCLGFRGLRVLGGGFGLIRALGFSDFSACIWGFRVLQVW